MDWANLLVILMSVFLAVFLIVMIVLIVMILRVTKQIRQLNGVTRTTMASARQAVERVNVAISSIGPLVSTLKQRRDKNKKEDNDAVNEEVI